MRKLIVVASVLLAGCSTSPSTVSVESLTSTMPPVSTTSTTAPSSTTSPSSTTAPVTAPSAQCAADMQTLRDEWLVLAEVADLYMPRQPSPGDLTRARQAAYSAGLSSERLRSLAAESDVGVVRVLAEDLSFLLGELQEGLSALADALERAYGPDVLTATDRLIAAWEYFEYEGFEERVTWLVDVGCPVPSLHTGALTFDGSTPTVFPSAQPAVAFITAGAPARDAAGVLGLPTELEAHMGEYTEPTLSVGWILPGPARLTIYDDATISASCHPQGQTRMALFGGVTLCGSSLRDLIDAWGDGDPCSYGECTVAFSFSYDGLDWYAKVGVGLYSDGGWVDFPAFSESALSQPVTSIIIFRVW